MDRLAALQDAIDQTGQTAARYQLPVLKMHAADISTGEPGRAQGWAEGAGQRLLIRIGELHAGCEVDGCELCETIAEALHVSLVALRDKQRSELEQLVGGGNPFARMRDLFGDPRQ